MVDRSSLTRFAKADYRGFDDLLIWISTECNPASQYIDAAPLSVSLLLYRDVLGQEYCLCCWSFQNPLQLSSPLPSFTTSG